MASWPLNKKVFTAKQDYTDNVLAAHVNELQDEIAAMQDNLGTQPNQGADLAGTTTAWATLKARLDAIMGSVRGHLHNGTDGSTKLAQANTHQSADTDSSTTALHHTLGTSANQAAAGNHGHTGLPTSSVTGLDSALAGKAPSLHGHDVSGASVNYATSAGSANSANWANSAGNADTVDGLHEYHFARAHDHPYASWDHGHGYMEPGGQYTMGANYPFTFPNLTVGATYSLTLSSGMVMQRNASSRRYKKDIEDLHTDLDAVRAIRPTQYRYDNSVEGVDSDERLMAGFIAEEVAEQFPLGVIWNEDGQPEDIDVRALIAAQQAVIRDLSARVEALEAR